MSDKDMIIELLGIAEVTEDGTVDFTDRAKEIIMDLAEKYRKTPIYEQAKRETPDWVNTATAKRDLHTNVRPYHRSTYRNAHDFFYKDTATDSLEKDTGGRGKGIFQKDGAVGKTESLLNQMGEILES